MNKEQQRHSDVNWKWIKAEQQKQLKCELDMNTDRTAKTIQMWTEHEF